MAGWGLVVSTQAHLIEARNAVSTSISQNKSTRGHSRGTTRGHSRGTTRGKKAGPDVKTGISRRSEERSTSQPHLVDHPRNSDDGNRPPPQTHILI